MLKVVEVLIKFPVLQSNPVPWKIQVKTGTKYLKKRSIDIRLVKVYV